MQTYGIYYKGTFTSLANLNTVKVLLSGYFFFGNFTNLMLEKTFPNGELQEKGCVCIWKGNSEVSKRSPTLILRKLGGQQTLRTNPQYVESGIRTGARLGANKVAYRSVTLADI